MAETEAPAKAPVDLDAEEELILEHKIKTFRVAFGRTWVECKASLTIGDRAAINQSTVTGKIVSRSGQETEFGQLSLGNSVLQTLVQAIVNWGGPAFCTTDHAEIPVTPGHRCEPIPITVKNIDKIKDTPAQKILAEINRRNPQPNTGNTANPTNGSAPKS